MSNPGVEDPPSLAVMYNLAASVCKELAGELVHELGRHRSQQLIHVSVVHIVLRMPSCTCGAWVCAVNQGHVHKRFVSVFGEDCLVMGSTLVRHTSLLQGTGMPLTLSLLCSCNDSGMVQMSQYKYAWQHSAAAMLDSRFDIIVAHELAASVSHVHKSQDMLYGTDNPEARLAALPQTTIVGAAKREESLDEQLTHMWSHPSHHSWKFPPRQAAS